ncbi:S1C family serine protease [Streptomyces otsuchiensis]|uniref:S1C family serine protease n=2 Tax=Streptomyces TaxID=1883 RepID=UPI0027D99992|nr:trypsin-like peptidase domain-containing protein [Streptomyces otsuchiensis]
MVPGGGAGHHGTPTQPGHATRPGQGGQPYAAQSTGAPGHPYPYAQQPHPAGAPAAAAPVADAGARRYDPWAAPSAPGGAFPPYGAGAPGQQPDEGPRRPRPVALVVGALVVALVAGGVGGLVGVQLERGGSFSQVRLPQATQPDRVSQPGTVAAIAEDALPGVVTLYASGGGSGGTGTGFVLDDEGHILTNAHVVRPARDGGRIQVSFHNGDAVRAELVGSDSGYDLAVVKVSGVSGLSALPLGDSDAVRVGDPVVAIGSPFDLDGTVTSGIISATDRPITAGGEGDGSDISYVNALQTDAPINPGNSGGPLVDERGQVIGINSAIRTPGGGDPDGAEARGGSVGLGFAIPVNQAKRIAEELINTGTASHPVLGVKLDLSYTGNGARVGSSASDSGVLPDGPGDRAGIEDGDVITAVDGSRVRSSDELIVKVRSHRPGDVLEVTLERDGSEITVEVELGRATSE